PGGWAEGSGAGPARAWSPGGVTRVNASPLHPWPRSSTSRFLIARTAGVGSGTWVTARAVDATLASPAATDAGGNASPSVRSIALGGSAGDSCQVRKLRVVAPVKPRPLSSPSLSLRHGRPDVPGA